MDGRDVGGEWHMPGVQMIERVAPKLVAVIYGACQIGG
jgi:hypothetical protein